MYMKSTLRFNKEDAESFFTVLRKRVAAYMATANHSEGSVITKVLVLNLAYFSLYTLLYTSNSSYTILLVYAGLGIMSAAILLNIIHEAAHDSLFKKKSWNKVALLWMEWMGTDGALWKRRHALHHAYSSIPGRDIDLSTTRLIRIDPKAPYFSFHKYQKYYAPLLYMMYTLFWFFVRDIDDIIYRPEILKLSLVRRIRMIVIKMIALFTFLFLPAYFSSLPFMWFFCGFIVMHITLSLIAIISVTSSHVNDQTVFPREDELGSMPTTWAVHQLLVTHDFGAENKFLTAFMGGFNFHVAHHLFPSIPNRYYQGITKIVKETAMEFNIPYHSTSVSEGIRSHFRLVFNNSNTPIDFDL